MLKLKLQYFGHLMPRTESLEETLIWYQERLKTGGEGTNRGWDGWMASPAQWPWVWVSSGSWWWTGKPGVLQSMGSQRVGHDWVTELNWLYSIGKCSHYFPITLNTEESYLVAQLVKSLAAMWETQVQSLGREDPLEKEMATHSSILAWRIPWTEEPGGLWFLGFQRVGHD